MQDELNISVAKIVATPSPSSWSQAYNAGKLFAVISLKSAEEDGEKDFLNVLGKDTIEALEQEYYSLEVKDLESTKSAFEKAVKTIPQNVEFSFTAASIVKNIIYIFYKGKVRVSIKRGDEFAELIDSEEDEEPKAISGEIKNGDIVIIQSEEFKTLIPTSALINYVKGDTPDEISETIAPLIHQDENSGASAIIIKASIPEKKEVAPQEAEEQDPEMQIEQEEEKFPTEKNSKVSIISSIMGKIKIPSFKKLGHSRKLILTIIIVIAVILGATVYFAIQKQNADKLNAMFEEVYTGAQEKYNEGESLAELNKNLVFLDHGRFLFSFLCYGEFSLSLQ